MEDEDLISIKPPKKDKKSKPKTPPTLEDVPNPEIVTDPPSAVQEPPEPPIQPIKDLVKREKVKTKDEANKFTEQSFVNNVEELNEALYESLIMELKLSQKRLNPNPKFHELTLQLLGVIKTPSQISITNNSLSNVGNTQNLQQNFQGASFEQIAENYRIREELGRNEEFQQKRLNKPSEIIEAEVVEVKPDE